MKNIVVLTGAGISKESGLDTFRDGNGLWNNHDIMEVASIDGWHKNKELVLDFYNKRRTEAWKAKPNKAHKLLHKLEEKYNVSIVTQNVDNLHEKAESKNIIHLHGELIKVRNEFDENLIYTINDREIKLGDKCENGFQLRPHIVWFGEAVPMIDKAIDIVKKADIFIIVGTSLEVYPASGLIDFVDKNIPKYIIDPTIPKVRNKYHNIKFIEKIATEGMQEVYDILMKNV